MSSTIVDLSEYGNVKGRDVFVRDISQSVKGDGSTAASITNTYYGIPSSTTTESILATTSVSESAIDSGIGEYTVNVHDGTTLNEMMRVSPTGLHLASGFVIAEDSAAEAASITLNSDGTPGAESISFTIGTTTPLDVFAITSTGVEVDGALIVDGTDILTTITGGNAWEINSTTVHLKADYPLVEINTLSVGGYTADVALDVNGSIVDRGNELYMYDVTGESNLSTLSFDSALNTLALRTSLADQSGTSDSINIQTTNGTDDTYLTRLSFAGGLGDQEATFSNVNVGIGNSPAVGKKLDVLGDSIFTGEVQVTANLDLVGTDLLNVSDITSTDTLAEQATITLTSSATDPQIDFILGDLDVSPITALTLTEAAATVNVSTVINDTLSVTGDVDITGNFTVSGTTTTVNTTEVYVEDKEIDLAYNALVHADIDGGGITLGSTTLSGSITLPTLLYNQATTAWQTSVDVNIPDANKFSVGTDVLGVSPTEVSAEGVGINTDTGLISMGASKQWRIRIENDGSNDHLYIEHDDVGAGTDWVVKLDIMQ